MTATLDQIESALRRAPRPEPPATLHQTLVDEIKLTPRPSRATSFAWRRWWALPLGIGMSLASIPALKQQTAQLAEIQRPAVHPTVSLSAPIEAAASPTMEIARLREKVAGLRDQIAQIETRNAAASALAADNSESSDPRVAQGLEEMAEMAARGESINCVNKLKNIGLSARTYAVDNQNIFPPDFLSMSNELSSPKILVCPSDPGRQPAPDWSSLTPANISYQYLIPGGNESEPQRVAFICPIHGHICLADGSVQMDVAKKNPEKLLHRDGKMIYQDSPPATLTNEAFLKRYGIDPKNGAPGSSQPPSPQGMDPRMMERYGLSPRSSTPPSQTPPR